MDRPVDPIFRRKQILKRIALSLFAAASAFALFGLAPRWMRPSLERSSIRTAIVDSGPVESTISASGTVMPEVEQVLSNPIEARVVRILKRPGAMLTRGEPILDLDVSDSELALDKLNEKLALKSNEQAQRKLELENTLINKRSQLRLKEIDVRSLDIQVARQQKLRAAGLNSEEQLRQAVVDAEKARVELKQFEESIRNEERSTEAKLEGLALEIATVRKETAQSRRQLELATTKADRSGVLTWVVTEEGAAVQKGDVLARIADLSSFRVQATVSDIHAGRLLRGLPARVKVGENDYLDGAVSEILPTIKDGIVTFLVSLEDKSSKLLRSNLRVDVFIVTDRKQRVLRVKRGAFAAGEGPADVFVVRGGRAVKTPVRIGLMSFDHCEIQGGVIEGDEIVISDMKDYVHLKEVELN